MGCIFCGIVDGSIPAHVVWEGEHALAFLDSRPVFSGHTLVVPRVHVETLPELGDDLLGPLFAAARLLAAAMPAAMAGDGTFVAVNNKVSQSVPHLHVHVIPRRFKDGLRGFFWPRQKYADEAEAAGVAAAIRKAVEELTTAGAYEAAKNP
ncbi:MAG TPA: HIT family protein [Actinomycetota bacterium]|nr:HIT family protein [Actinomycetota bacterium]